MTDKEKMDLQLGITDPFYLFVKQKVTGITNNWTRYNDIHIPKDLTEDQLNIVIDHVMKCQGRWIENYIFDICVREGLKKVKENKDDTKTINGSVIR